MMVFTRHKKPQWIDTMLTMSRQAGEDRTSGQKGPDPGPKCSSSS